MLNMSECWVVQTKLTNSAYFTDVVRRKPSIYNFKHSVYHFNKFIGSALGQKRLKVAYIRYHNSYVVKECWHHASAAKCSCKLTGYKLWEEFHLAAVPFLGRWSYPSRLVIILFLITCIWNGETASMKSNLFMYNVHFFRFCFLNFHFISTWMKTYCCKSDACHIITRKWQIISTDIYSNFNCIY